MTAHHTADLGEWTLEGGEIELDGTPSIVEVRVAGGAVRVAVTDGPPRVIVGGTSGGPVVVRQSGPVLSIRQAGPEGPDAVGDLIASLLEAFKLRGTTARHADVTVLLPAPARTSVRSVGAEVMFSGLEDASVDTVSGDVTVNRVAGSLRVVTVSGAVQAAHVDGRVSVSTVSGDVTVAGGRLTELRGRTVSGDATLDVELLPGAHAFQAVTGDLALRVVAPAGLDLDCTTVSGTLTSGFGPPADLTRPGVRRLRARSGGGGAALRTHSVSGDVTVVEGGR